MNKQSKLISRSNVINYIYKFELMDEEFNNVDAFEKGNFTEEEMKKIEILEKNYKRYKSLVNKHIIDGWSWSRLAPLERAILIYGSFELSYMPKALVINEMVILTQAFIPGDSYKFINSILQRVGEYFEKIKAS